MPEFLTTRPTLEDIARSIPANVRTLRVIEILTIFWVGGSNTKHYSNQRWVDDFPALVSFGFDVIEARFQRSDWFVEMPRTTEISDDVVKLTMWDSDAELITDYLASGEGTRCRVTQYFPDFDFAGGIPPGTPPPPGTPSGFCIEIWWGFLKAPKETEGLWFNIEAASGLRSPNLIIPRRSIYQGCQAIFGGLINPITNTPYFDTQAKVDANECPYNRHIAGGTHGNLQGAGDPSPGQPFTTCPRRTPADCDKRLGSWASNPLHVHYLAFDVVIEAYNEANRTNTSYANDNVLRKPVRVVYGQRWVRDLTLLAFVQDSSTGSNQFLKTLWVVCEGPIMGPQIAEPKPGQPGYGVAESPGVSPHPPGAGSSPLNASAGFVVNGQWVQNGNTDFSGIWGVEVQPKLVNFTPNVLYYKHTSMIQLDYGRADFRNFQGDNLECRGYIKGNKKIKQWTTPTGAPTTEYYTNNRAWCLLDLYTNKRYGVGVDHSRFVIQDWITLANYCNESVSSIDETGTAVSIPRTVFNADIQEGKWSDHLSDICLAGYFTLPYYHQGQVRIDPIELGTTASPFPTSVPVFSDQDDATASGLTRNIIFESNKSTLRYSMESDSKLPNQIKINFDDAQFEGQSRPLTLKDEDQQLRAGYAAGDETLRPVEKEYNAVGVDTLAAAYRLARRILDLGPFEQGGLHNNFKVTFKTWSLLTDVLGLHPYSIIKIVSDTVNRFEEDATHPYQYFRVQKLTRLKDLTMQVEAQLYPQAYIESTLNAQPAPGVANASGSVMAAPNSVSFAGVSATAGTVNFTLTVVPGGGSGSGADPVITDGPYSGSIGTDTVTITWTTDIPSDSEVEYGYTTTYGLTATDAEMVTDHSITLVGLTPDTTYHYRVSSYG